MSTTDADAGRPGRSSSEAVLTVSEERAFARRLRVPVELVRVAKRVRTETVRVEVDVEVRHEELVVTSEPIPEEMGRQMAAFVSEDDDEGDREVVLVLSREVPVVGVQVEPVEVVTVGTRRVETSQLVEVDLAREVVETDSAREASDRS